MIDEAIKNLKNLLCNKTALIVSAGPSAIKWRDVYNSIQDQDPTIVCIKQAVEMEDLSEICDIHFINSYNLKKYKYKKRPLIIFSDAVDAPRVFNQYDVRMTVFKSKRASLKHTLAYKNNFDDYRIEITGIERPWGPGIMYETVFHTLLYMGVKKIITVGWDIGDNIGRNKHFDDKRCFAQKMFEILRRVFYKLRIEFLYNFTNFIIGKKYNHADMLEGEAEMVSKSVPYLKKWLESKNVELEIVSESKWMKQ